MMDKISFPTSTWVVLLLLAVVLGAIMGNVVNTPVPEGEGVYKVIGLIFQGGLLVIAANGYMLAHERWGKEMSKIEADLIYAKRKNEEAKKKSEVDNFVKQFAEIRIERIPPCTLLSIRLTEFFRKSAHIYETGEIIAIYRECIKSKIPNPNLSQQNSIYDNLRRTLTNLGRSLPSESKLTDLLHYF